MYEKHHVTAFGNSRSRQASRGGQPWLGPYVDEGLMENIGTPCFVAASGLK